jgi:serine-type anaerobic sulfatase-maturating enzyme
MSTESLGTGVAPFANARPGFDTLAAPIGATPGHDCAYCVLQCGETQRDGAAPRMPAATHEAYIRQMLESQRTPRVTMAWQGGEPTLMGLEFFRRSVELAEKYRGPAQVVQHTFQTDGLLLDDEWCAFFERHGFLVALSIDGPREVHDVYRVGRDGSGTFDGVMRAWRLLRKHGVDSSIACTVNAANQDHGRTVYRFFRDVLGARSVQFIPVVERDAGNGNLVTPRSVGARQYGRFLIDIFEEWVRNDVGLVYVRLFDETLEGFFGRHKLCIHAPTCGEEPSLARNGDLFSCDRFVQPRYLLGNILAAHMRDLVASPAQGKFGNDKRDTLTVQCRNCPVLSLCNGGCPKDRFALSRDGEAGQNYLCEGLELFFSHAREAIEAMAQLLLQYRPPSVVMALVAGEDELRDPHQPCPCGSGVAFVLCHGDAAPGPPFAVGNAGPGPTVRA